MSGFIFGNVADWLFGEQGKDDIEYLIFIQNRTIFILRHKCKIKTSPKLVKKKTMVNLK